MIDNPSGADQSGLVDTFIESNLTRVSKAQHYMFAYLRDMRPKPQTLKEAYRHLLKKMHDTDAACQIGLQVGMIFPSDPTQLQHQEPTKIGGSDNTGAKRPRGDNDKQSQSSSQSSSAKVKYDGACTRCGTKGHRAKQCARPADQSHYLNDDPNTEYADSQAWQNVINQWPGMLSATEYPRCPSKQHIFSIEGPPKKGTTEVHPLTKPSGGGGRGRGGRGSRGRGGGRGKGGKCKCSIHNDEHCTLTDEEYLATLVKTNAPLHLNFTNIYTPTVVTNTYALIDTGAIHGSYAGTWIKALNLRAGNKKLNTQICSPINNSCISLTDSVIAVVDIFDVDKKFKITIEIELKILSSLDDRDYGIIIGLPDIKKHSLLSKFANQFNDCEVVRTEEGLESPRGNNYPKGESLSNKFANLSEDMMWVKGASSWLQSLPSSRDHTRTPAKKARLSKEELKHEDTLCTAQETQSHRGFPNRQHYDDDKEVIEYKH